MKNIIIGTAGHIDHGKTTLIKALTGRNTDRLKEEIKRGISIDLGFTYFDLKNGKRAGIIDVPGHEKFVKKMVSGACGIDIVMLTIAANEGIKNQTIEHIDILNYLNIKGIIVLTKCDLVDDETIEKLTCDIKKSLSNTSFFDANIIKVDSLSGRGLNDLTDELERLSDATSSRNTDVPPRMYIDRVFTLKGFGTVVTGTLIEGKIQKGDELIIYPTLSAAKIRNIQVHDNSVDTAYAGQRTALNISNLKVSEISKGDVLSGENNLINTLFLDAKIMLTENTETELKFFDRVRVLTGSKEVLARFVPIDKSSVKASEDVYCQLRLEEQMAVKKDDVVIIRSYSPVNTIGGGIILSPNPPKHKRSDKQVIQSLKIKEQSRDLDLIDDFIRNSRGKSLDDCINYLNLNKNTIQDILNSLVSQKSVFKANNLYFHIDLLDELSDKTIRTLSNYHENNKLRKGMPKEEFKSKLKADCDKKEIDAVIKKFESDKLIKNVNGYISLYDFIIELSDEQQNIKKDLINKLIKSGFAALTLDELTNGNKKYKEVLLLITDDFIVKLAHNVYIHPDYLNKAKQIVKNMSKKSKKILLADFRDQIKLSRKYAMYLLDYFDSTGFTKRIDDYRILL